MRLCTYITDGHQRLGIVGREGQLVELAAAHALAGQEGRLPQDMLELIAAFDALDHAALVAAADSLDSIDVDSVTVVAPVPNPSKIVGVAINNAAIANLATHIADDPVFFSTPVSSLTGHASSIVIYEDYGLTHPEAELGVVIGQRLSQASPNEAAAAVFGYTIVNDVTSIGLKSGDTIVFPPDAAGAVDRSRGDGVAPGFEYGAMQLTYHARSKGTDTFTPCGPWITTADEISDPSSLGIRLWMGDELCTEDSVSRLRHDVPHVLSHVSRYLTLEPGDLVHMGTAVTGKYKLRELDFQHWDGPCSIEIDGLGRLSNPIDRRSR